MLWLWVVGIPVAVIGFSIFFGAPYVPSRRKYLDRLFDHIKLGPKDVLVDVGSGDGIVLRRAMRRGARAIGYEVHPILLGISRLASPGAKIIWRDFWRAELPSDTTVVYLFGIHRDEKRIAVKLQKEASRLGRPIKFICYGNPLPNVSAKDKFEAYSIYEFTPLQGGEA